MDFDIGIIAEIPIADGFTLQITETVVGVWVVMALLITLSVIIRIKSRKWSYAGKPAGLQNFAEMLVSTFINFFKSSASPKVMYLAPWFFALFSFLLLSNIVGILNLRNPTADWSMTFPLAVSSFVLIQAAGIIHRPKSYLGNMLATPLAPLNILGELARPVSLSLRLFGNVLGGFIIFALLYGIAPLFIRFAIPVPLHIYFDIAVGALQAYIFVVISLTFVGLAAEE